jgi:hypothetical protein
MIIPYVPGKSKQPIPSLGGALTRWRPITAVRLTRPSHTWLCDGLLDSGADDTVFEEDLAALVGVDLSQAESRQLLLAGRPQPITCRYASVELRVTDGKETYTWTAIIGFAQSRLRYPLLGHAGFLQYFNSDFQGADRQVVLTANRSFPGTAS